MLVVKYVPAYTKVKVHLKKKKKKKTVKDSSNDAYTIVFLPDF